MMTERKPTHPGVVFREDVMEPCGLSVTDTAALLHVSRKALSEVLNGHSALSAEMALRWAKFTETTVESWYQMQVNLDLWHARQNSNADMVEVYRAS